MLTVEGGVARLDKGAIDGLAAGDQGRITYSLSVGGGRKSIPAGRGRIVTAGDFDSTLEPLDGATVRPGYEVEIEVPPERMAPDRRLERARELEQEGDLERAFAYLERLRVALPDDPLVKERIADLEAARAHRDVLARERDRIPYYREAARELLERDRLDQARTYADKLLALLPDDQETAALVADIERRRLTRGMVLVPGGEYTIGVDLERAQFYSQTPRFQVPLEPFWIDREPVTRAAYAGKPGLAASTLAQRRSEATAPATDLTWADAAAYCESQGKRLPTELEWEAAATTAGLDGPESLDEWTASWYGPYPGNRHGEKEYGQRMRVLRRLSGSRDDPALRVRRFMAPVAKQQSVGFRCVRVLR